MALSMLAVRIPESQHKYIKYKSIDTGRMQQDIVAEIIDHYQRSDTEFMQKFESLTGTSSAKEGTDGA